MSAHARTLPTRRPWARALMVAAGLLLAASTLSACASARDELGTASSNCYIELAGAFGAVHHHGHLVGVRLVSVESLRESAPLLYLAARADEETRSDQVCLIAIRGIFRARDVARPIGARKGDLAVAELAYPRRRLLATLVTSLPPLDFGHSHI